MVTPIGTGKKQLMTLSIFNPGESAGFLEGKNTLGLINTKNLSIKRIFF